MSKLKEYLKTFDNKHNVSIFDYDLRERLDYDLRKRMGKIGSDGSICSHNKIIARELGENFCRICHKELKIGVARFNDYLVIRNRDCVSAICLDCSKNNPDKYYLAFRKAVNEIEVIE